MKCFKLCPMTPQNETLCLGREEMAAIGYGRSEESAEFMSNVEKRVSQDAIDEVLGDIIDDLGHFDDGDNDDGLDKRQKCKEPFVGITKL